MDTKKIKPFAQKSRQILISGVNRRLAYWGFNKNGEQELKLSEVEGGYFFRDQVFDDTEIPKKWDRLNESVKIHTFTDVKEEGAYTWFNRLMAIRILEKNGYIRPMLEAETGGAVTPIILKEARQGRPFFLDEQNYNKLKPAILDYQRESEAFNLLIINYCKKNELLNKIFGKLDDYTELLIPDNLLIEDGFIALLNSSEIISDEDYKREELLGWLYQFYISEKKDEVFAGFKNKKKARPEDIPAATQIFTPRWIVKYMCENTLGRIWLDKEPESSVKNSMKYLIEPEEDYKSEKSLIGNVEDLKLLDPACGSGHILLVGFDILYKIFKEEGYSSREAVEKIIENNLYGLDIDKRAAQLAKFAVFLKGASYYSDILKSRIKTNIHFMPEYRYISKDEVMSFLGDGGKEFIEEFYLALEEMKLAQNVGSALTIKLSVEAREYIKNRFEYLKEAETSLSMLEKMIFTTIKPFIEIILIMTDKFPTVVANPPYMGTKNMNADLKDYVAKHYPMSKSDLFAVFMEVCLNQNINHGFMGMINQHSWMFLSSFEKLRTYILDNHEILNMVHLGPRTFDELSGEVVQSTAFVLRR